MRKQMDFHSGAECAFLNVIIFIFVHINRPRPRSFVRLFAHFTLPSFHHLSRSLLVSTNFKLVGICQTENLEELIRVGSDDV
jgi:hypothetical protein